MACRRSPVRARLAPLGEPPHTWGFLRCRGARWSDRSRLADLPGARLTSSPADEEVFEGPSDLLTVACAILSWLGAGRPHDPRGLGPRGAKFDLGGK